MKKIAIIYGSSTGNTESIAFKIAARIGEGRAEVINVKEITLPQLATYRNLIFGISTWGIGELQGDWKRFLLDLDQADLKGKTIAMFGLGDAESYPDSFVDGMGTVYEVLKSKGCEIIGGVETEDYNFDRSAAVYDGRFIGLPLDEDNESDMTESRIENWLSKILNRFTVK
jgi:flavodoxin I